MEMAIRESKRVQIKTKLLCYLAVTTLIFEAFKKAKVAELVDARDSKSRSFGSVGSSPTFGTIKALQITAGLFCFLKPSLLLFLKQQTYGVKNYLKCN